jgi:hypothetical protein
MPFSYVEMDGSGADSELPFTYADYKAMTREKVEELYLVPENMASDYLVPLHNFLRLGQNDLTGKVPYIWLVDEDNRMVRAAVPYMWVQSCQERLDFWNFIQELGGVNSYHVNLALANARTEWEKAKAQELSTLQAAQQKELADARAKAAGEAISRDSGTKNRARCSKTCCSTGYKHKTGGKSHACCNPCRPCASRKSRSLRG